MMLNELHRLLMFVRAACYQKSLKFLVLRIFNVYPIPWIQPLFLSSQPQEATTGRAATSCWAAIAARDPSAHSKISELRGRFAGKKWEDHLPMGDLHCHLWLQDITKIQKNMGVGWFWHGSFFSNPTAEFTATFPFSTKSGFFRWSIFDFWNCKPARFPSFYILKCRFELIRTGIKVFGSPSGHGFVEKEV